MRGVSGAVSFPFDFPLRPSSGIFHNAAGRSSRSWNLGFVPGLGSFEAKNRRRLWGTSGGRRDIKW